MAITSRRQVLDSPLGPIVHEPDEIAIRINRKLFEHWSSIDIELSVDSFSSVEFTAPFDRTREEMRKAFRPFTFQPIDITIGDKPLFSGRCIGIDPQSDSSSSTVRVSAYALAGTLGDCCAPVTALPLSFLNLNLHKIAEALAKPFGIDVEFRGDPGLPFDNVKLEVGRQVNDFLAELARLRGLVITSTPDGKLLCWQSVKTGHPVARLSDQEQPVTKVSAKFNPQEYYSEISGFMRATKKRAGMRYTERNPFLKDVLRPLTFALDNTEKGGAVAATQAKLGRMLANMCSFDVDVCTWRDPKGALWAPNTTLVLTAPDAMVYRPYEFLIRTVTLHEDAHEQSATLGLVLPGAFSGTAPATLPWDPDPDPSAPLFPVRNGFGTG